MSQNTCIGFLKNLVIYTKNFCVHICGLATVANVYSYRANGTLINPKINNLFND